jgi:hypothetical protein
MKPAAKIFLVVDGRAEDEALIEQMAADLRRLGVTSNERDAIRALSSCERYRMGDVAALAEDALYAARQSGVAAIVKAG